MKFLAPFFALLLALAPASAIAQSSPGWSPGFVPTAGQWNQAYANKQDYLGVPPLLTSGGTMTGKINANPSIAGGAGLNLGQGTAPTTPVNGDLWVTSAGLYVQVNGSTVGPLNVSGGGSGTVGSGTIGQVAFYNATGTTVAGASKLLWDDTSKSLNWTTNAAPPTPGANTLAVWADTTNVAVLSTKNPAGLTSNTVQPITADGTNFLTGVAATGAFTRASAASLGYLQDAGADESVGGKPTFTTAASPQVVNGKGPCNMIGYGANVANTAHVNTLAINAALSANCRVLYFPSPAAAMSGDGFNPSLPTNCYLIEATINITGVGAGIWGDGPSVSCISGNGEFADVTTNSTSNATLGFILLRHSTQIGVGFDATTASGSNTQLYNVMASGNRVGAQLGAHSNQPMWFGGGFENNLWDGVQFIQTSGQPTVQGVITGYLTVDGILHVSSITSGAGTGLPVTVGAMIACTTFPVYSCGLPPNVEIMSQLSGTSGQVGTYQTTMQTVPNNQAGSSGSPISMNVYAGGGGSGWGLRDVTCTNNGGSGIFITGSGPTPNTPNLLDNLICYTNGNYQVYCSAGTVDNFRLGNSIFGGGTGAGNDTIRLDCGTLNGVLAPNYLYNVLVETPHASAAAVHVTGGGNWVFDKFLSHNGFNGAYCMQFGGAVNDVRITNSHCDGFLTTGILFANSTGGGGGMIVLHGNHVNSNVTNGVNIGTGYALSSKDNHIWNNPSANTVMNGNGPINSSGDNCGAVQTSYAPCNWTNGQAQTSATYLGNLGSFAAPGTTSATTVNNTAVTANSQIKITLKTLGGTPNGTPYLASITPGTGFTFKAASTDTSTYNYELEN
jgi:hypothetical protein